MCLCVLKVLSRQHKTPMLLQVTLFVKSKGGNYCFRTVLQNCALQFQKMLIKAPLGTEYSVNKTGKVKGIHEASILVGDRQ